MEFIYQQSQMQRGAPKRAKPTGIVATSWVVETHNFSNQMRGWIKQPMLRLWNVGVPPIQKSLLGAARHCAAHPDVT